MKKIFPFLITILFLACKPNAQVKTENTEEELVIEETNANGYTIGDIATDFSLKNIDDNFISLSDYEDAKGFVVIFTCNHCPFSVAYEDRIIELDKKYKPQGYPVIAINPNDPEAPGGKGDDFESMKIRAAEKGFTFPYLYDEQQEIYPKYGATKTPHVYLLQKSEQGNIVKYIGTIDDNHKNADAVKEKYLENAIIALLEGKNPQPNLTKAIGCSIKTLKK